MPRRVTRSTSRPNISFNSDSMSSSSNKLCPAPSAKLTSTSTSLSGPKSSRNTDPKSASSTICQRRQKSRRVSGEMARESFNGAPSTAGIRFRCGHRFPTGMIPGCCPCPSPALPRPPAVESPSKCFHPHSTRLSHKPAAVQTPVPDGRQGTHGRRAGCGSRGPVDDARAHRRGPVRPSRLGRGRGSAFQLAVWRRPTGHAERQVARALRVRTRWQRVA